MDFNIEAEAYPFCFTCAKRRGLDCLPGAPGAQGGSGRMGNRGLGGVEEPRFLFENVFSNYSFSARSWRFITCATASVITATASS